MPKMYIRNLIKKAKNTAKELYDCQGISCDNCPFYKKQGAQCVLRAAARNIKKITDNIKQCETCGHIICGDDEE